jgi:hypothetical protein
VEPRRYLYHARINAHLTLQQIGVRTALSPTVLRNLDEGRFELLPSGVYARSYVRTFAVAVGIDPEAALAELEQLLPGAPDPVPALNARRTYDWPAEWLLQWRASVASVGTAFREKGSRELSRMRHRCRDAQRELHDRISLDPVTRSIHSGGALLDRVVERVRRISENDVAAETALKYTEQGIDRCDVALSTIADRARHYRQTHLAGLTRCGAAAIDAALLMVVDAFLVLLISWSSGIPVESLLQDAGWALGAFCAIPIALYFVLFGGIAGSTLGRYVCDLVEPLRTSHDRPHHPLTLPDILRRSVGR